MARQNPDKDAKNGEIGPVGFRGQHLSCEDSEYLFEVILAAENKRLEKVYFGGWEAGLRKLGLTKAQRNEIQDLAFMLGGELCELANAAFIAGCELGWRGVACRSASVPADRTRAGEV